MRDAMSHGHIVDLDRTPPFGRHEREEFAREIARILQILGSKTVIMFDSHAIQITLFPHTGSNFVIRGHAPQSGVIKDGVYTE